MSISVSGKIVVPAQTTVVISTSPVNGGTTNPSGPQTQKTLTVTATPASGFKFAYWLLNGSNVGNANPYTYNKVSTITDQLVAVFTQILIGQNLLPDIRPLESLTTSSRLISDTKPVESVSHTQ